MIRVTPALATQLLRSTSRAHAAAEVARDQATGGDRQRWQATCDILQARRRRLLHAAEASWKRNEAAYRYLAAND